MAVHSAVNNQSSALDRWQGYDVEGLSAAFDAYWMQQYLAGGGRTCFRPHGW